MAASGSVVELRNSRARTAAQHLQAPVDRIAACVHEADGPELGELLIQIREVGVDPLEAAFATGVRRFDRSGEYAADGALSVVVFLQAEDGIRGTSVTGVQTCALPISGRGYDDAGATTAPAKAVAAVMIVRTTRLCMRFLSTTTPDVPRYAPAPWRQPANRVSR